VTRFDAHLSRKGKPSATGYLYTIPEQIYIILTTVLIDWRLPQVYGNDERCADRNLMLNDVNHFHNCI